MGEEKCEKGKGLATDPDHLAHLQFLDLGVKADPARWLQNFRDLKAKAAQKITLQHWIVHAPHSAKLHRTLGQFDELIQMASLTNTDEGTIRNVHSDIANARELQETIVLQGVLKLLCSIEEN